MTAPLNALEEELNRIRSGDVSPITELIWQDEGEFITAAARGLCEGEAKVLDVGCGRGTYLIALAKEKGNECYGIDPLEETSLKPAREKAKAENLNIQFLCASGEKIPFSDDMFDVVLLISTLQHVADQNKVLQEIKRVLKDGGRLLVSVPQRRGIYSARRLLSEVKRKLTLRQKIFMMDFNYQILKKMLADNGFILQSGQGRKFLPLLCPTILGVMLKLKMKKIVIKMLEISDGIADRMKFTASNLVVICRKEKCA